MSDNKNLVTVIVSVSLAVLIIVCLGLFWLTWTALSEAERVKEENHQLLLGNTVCQLRLENLQETAPKTAVAEQTTEPTPAATPVPTPPAPQAPQQSVLAPVSAEVPSDQRVTPQAPTAVSAPVVLHDPWFVQLGAYKRRLPAEDFVREASDILADAGFKLSVFAVKKGSHWLVCINEPLTKPRARALADAVRKQAELESVITHLPAGHP